MRDFTLTSGARVNRQNGTIFFTGEKADAKIAGAYLLAGRQHADTRLVDRSRGAEMHQPRDVQMRDG